MVTISVTRVMVDRFSTLYTTKGIPSLIFSTMHLKENCTADLFVNVLELTSDKAKRYLIKM